MEKEVKCPSGMVGRIRALKVADEKLYNDPQLIKDNRLLVEWCKRCWLDTLDPGPYSFSNGEIDWDKILLGDIFYLFFELIKMKIGKFYEFEHRCPECRTRIARKVDLEEELFIKDLHKDIRAAFAAGQTFTTELEDGRMVRFRLLLAGDQKMIGQLEETRKITTSRASAIIRLQEVEGVKFDSFWDKPTFVEELDSYVADQLEDSMEKIDCGVDTDIEMSCPEALKCGWEDVIQLPLKVGLFRKVNRSLQGLRERKAQRTELRERQKNKTTNLE